MTITTTMTTTMTTSVTPTMTTSMTLFHIRYRDTQGTLMRLLNAVSRRAIQMPYLETSPENGLQRLTLSLDVTPKQTGQLMREWSATIDVVEVLASAANAEQVEQPKPPQEVWAVASHAAAIAMGQA